jgi:hypothetical protein
MSNRKKQHESENAVKARAKVAMSNAGAVTFANLSGAGVFGKVLSVAKGNIYTVVGKILRAGLGASEKIKGSPDRVGYKSVVITPAMVGRRVAIFVGVELKADDGDLTVEQDWFLRALAKAGAICGVARTAEEAEAIIREEKSYDPETESRSRKIYGKANTGTARRTKSGGKA